MIPTFILAIENDDDRAFIEHIYKKYYNLMYSKAYDILQNRDCVDDVINNACIKLIPKIQKLRTFNCCVLAACRLQKREQKGNQIQTLVLLQCI